MFVLPRIKRNSTTVSAYFLALCNLFYFCSRLAHDIVSCSKLLFSKNCNKQPPSSVFQSPLLITVHRHSRPWISSWKLPMRVQTWILLSGRKVPQPILQWHRHRRRIRKIDDGESCKFASLVIYR